MNEDIINKYGLKKVELICKSNYGIIYKAISDKWGDVIIKENHDNRNYHDSCKYYNKFKKLPLCQMYCYDNDYKIQILEFVKGNKIFEIHDFKDRINIGYRYFKNWEKNLITITEDDISFEKAVNEMFLKLKNMELPNKDIGLIEVFRKKTNHFFKNYNNSFLIHGDLHHDNMLYSNGKVVAIDLSPRKTNFAIEIAKFIENELFNNVDKISKMLDIFLSLYKFETISEDELLEGLFIDSCYRTFDSLLENGRDDDFEKGVYMNKQILEYFESRY